MRQYRLILDKIYLDADCFFEYIDTEWKSEENASSS